MSPLFNFNIYIQISIVIQHIAGVVSLLGVAGNTLVFGLFSRPALRKHTYSFYCQAKSISDTLLLLDAVNNWFTTLAMVSIASQSQLLCTIVTYSRHVANTTGVCLLVVISLDRLLTVVYPNRFPIVKKRTFQFSLVLGVVAYSFLVNIIVPFNTIWKKLPNFGTREKKCSFESRVSSAHLDRCWTHRRLCTNHKHDRERAAYLVYD